MQTMSGLDSLFLHVENDVSHMHLGAVALFEGPAPAAGEFAEVLAGKLALLGPYRQRVRWVPWGWAGPMWVEDPHFELSYHLRHTALPRPGDAAVLTSTRRTVMAQPLDRQRPLWEMWVIEGAGAGRWGLICKLHHRMVDGISAGDLLAVLRDPSRRRPLRRRPLAAIARALERERARAHVVRTRVWPRTASAPSARAAARAG